MEGANAREKRHRRLIAWQVWHTAVLVRGAEVPPMESLMPDAFDQPTGPPAPKRQSVDEMLAIAKAIAAATGGRIERREEGDDHGG